METASQPLRPSKMFKYGTFSSLFGTAKKAPEATDSGASQSPSAPASAPAPAAASAPAKRTKCIRISLAIMGASAVALLVGLLAGLLTRHANAGPTNPGTGVGGNSTTNSTSRPNIVFIMTDDQDKRLFSTDYQPVLQRELVEKGTNFTNHYTTQALCCPARSSMLRGQQTRELDVAS